MNQCDILITGGAGYIGSHAVYAALDKGLNVLVVDNLSTGCRENLPDDLAFVEGNIGDKSFMDDVLSKYQPNVVMHFAASIVVPESVSDPYKYYTNNTLSTLNLIQACSESTSVKRFIFSSTAAVYGIPEGGIAYEDTPLKPINPYGASKMMSEKILQDICRVSKFNSAILRYFNVAGADEKGRTGQSTPNATHLIKVACQVALKERAQLEIYGTDYETEDGTCIRDYIHVSDLIDAHFKVLDCLKQKSNKVLLFNCGNGQGYSVREVIASVERICGHKLPVVESMRRLGDPDRLIASPEQLKEKSGWSAQYQELDKIVSSAYQWEKGLQELKAIK